MFNLHEYMELFQKQVKNKKSFKNLLNLKNAYLKKKMYCYLIKCSLYSFLQFTGSNKVTLYPKRKSLDEITNLQLLRKQSLMFTVIRHNCIRIYTC